MTYQASGDSFVFHDTTTYRKFCSASMLALLRIVLIALAVSASAGQVFANPYIVVDAKTERVLFANEPFKRWYPASLTKLMTAYLAFEDMEAGRASKHTVITFSASAANEIASKMYFAPGTRVTLDTALKMMLVHSANDAARAVAESAPAGRDAFLARMNATAKRLGMVDTHFVNANGVPHPGQYTTARDMAVLALAIEDNFPQYMDYFTIPGLDADSGRYRNTNLLVGNFEGVTGMKTGFICASGYNQVSTAKRGRNSVVAVAFGAPSIPERAEMAAHLLEVGLTADSRNGPRLDSYLPPEGHDMTVADISGSVCTAEAAAERAKLKDEKGHYILNSPYLKQLPEDYATIPAFRLPNDTEMASSRLETLSVVPLPYARPVQ